MKTYDLTAVIIVSIYLVIYTILLQLGLPIGYTIYLWILSPFLVVGMVYTVLKYGKYEGRELGEDEFGYQDKSQEELGVF